MFALHFLHPLKPLLVIGGGDGSAKKTSRREHFMTTVVIYATDRDSQQFEIDPDKAKAALQELDQQLQSFSKKQTNTPKIKASDVNFTRDPMIVDEPPEISGSFLAYSAFFLLAFTFLYNLLFYTVIKPSIDVPESVPASSMEEASLSNPVVFQFVTPPMS